MFAIINLTYVFSFYLLIISITNCDAGIICDARHIVGSYYICYQNYELYHGIMNCITA